MCDKLNYSADFEDFPKWKRPRWEMAMFEWFDKVCDWVYTMLTSVE